jgi:hypothetical protein
MNWSDSHVVSWKHDICTTMVLVGVSLIITTAVIAHVWLCAIFDGPRIIILSRLSLVGISQMSVASLRR